MGGVTCRTPPIPRSALEKDPRPEPLFEGNPVGEGTTGRGTATPVHRPQRPAGSTHSSTRGLRPPEQLERQAGFPSSDKTRPDSPVPTLQGPCGRSPQRRGSLGFLPPLEMRPSSIAPTPVESREAPLTPQHPSPLRGTLEVPSGPRQKSREMRFSRRHSRKTSIVLLQSVLRPLSPLWTREQ